MAARAKPDAGYGHRRKSSMESSDDSTRLSQEDVHALFVGAPYFLLDQGAYGLWQPQVIFPWCDHDLLIQNFWDRKPLSHVSFSLSTLHAHLPVPDGWVVKGDTPAPLQGLHHTGGPKRATFDVGVYEVPNMLCFNGKEPGSFGFRHYLELPVADQARYTGPEIPKRHPGLRRLSNMPAMEAFDAIEHHANDPYAQCLDGTVHDRKALLLNGPSAWKRIGVRDPSIENLIERLETLRAIRHNILHAEVDKMILDIEPLGVLHRDLFSKFLHPPPRSMIEEEDPHTLKAQIRMLTTALAAPGAWFNFSLEEWRLHIGQILWEVPPHREGDFLETDESEDAQKRPWVNPGLERKWFLIQMLLASELLIRLDAVSRAGVLRDPDENITALDIHEFDKLRDGKVNWDLIVVRRFLDSFGISRRESANASTGHSEEGLHGRHRSLRDVFTLHRRSSIKAAEAGSAWECNLTPFHIEQQLHGLFVFAENIGWPRLDVLKELPSKISKDLYSRPVCSAATSTLGKQQMYSRNPSRRQIVLHNIESNDSTEPQDSIGWITRSWLSGFVPPGETISHLLLATVLENDPEALSTLGPVANLYGGFSYHGRSWWNKQCIVGRVLASLPETKECMGWIRSDVLPVDRSTSQPLDGRWFEARIKELPPTAKKPRIQQGNKISHFSTPLGDGDLSREAFSLPVDRPREVKPVELDRLTFVSDPESDATSEGVGTPTVTFNLPNSPDHPSKHSIPLTYNIHFVTSYNCRPPAGKASSASDTSDNQHDRLPGHPLHASYEYRLLPVSDLTSATSLHKLVPGGEILVVDARGGATQETFARAWCASTGSNAVISRVGRTCLACCIREAMAVDVPVVIRVSDGVWNRPGELHRVVGAVHGA